MNFIVESCVCWFLVDSAAYSGLCSSIVSFQHDVEDFQYQIKYLDRVLIFAVNKPLEDEK